MLLFIVTLFLFLEVSPLLNGECVLGEILLERSGLTGYVYRTKKTRFFYPIISQDLAK
jgi:hypothetical protein